MKSKQRILMIVNEFPPTGESGVQRPLKFLKYLVAEGWECHVITPARPTKTVLDESLHKEIPPKAKIYRTRSWGFSGKSVDRVADIRQDASSWGIKGLLSKILIALNHAIFPIDKQIGWVPFAYFKALQVIRRYRIRNVYITAFPFSAFLIGILLKRKLKDRIHWVADYRDAWQFEPLLHTRIPASRLNLIRRVDRAVIESCDNAVFVTPSIHQEYREAFTKHRDKMVMITNGYDEADFEGLEPYDFSSPAMVYMGKIYDIRRPDNMLRAIKAGSFDLPLVHIGSLCADAKKAIAAGDYGFYQYWGYKQHKEALSIALGAELNLLLLNDDEASEGVYSGKVFELLRLGRPILALGPKECIVKDLILETAAGEYVWLKDEKGIIAAIKRILDNPRAYAAHPDYIKRFDRKVLSHQLAELYE